MRFRPGLVVVFGVLLTASACASGGISSSPSNGSPSAAGPSTGSPPATASSTPAPGPSSSGSPSPVPGGGSAITVVVDDGTGATTRWTLTCDPVGGDHPQATQACAALEARASALRPVPKDRMCAQVYGGPEKATITGTWRGEPVLATLNRTNACETARWDALVPLVPSGGS